MTKSDIEKMILPLTNRHQYTDKDESIALLNKIDRAYYIDDINYMSIGDRVYTFWPFGVGNSEQFCYIRFFEDRLVNGKVYPKKPSFHLSSQTEKGIADIINALPFSVDDVSDLSVNVGLQVDIGSVLRQIHGFEDVSFEDNEGILERYVPTESTFALASQFDFVVRSAVQDPLASYENILNTHPEITPAYHAASVAKRFVLQSNKDERQNIEEFFLDETLTEDTWTLYQSNEPIMSVIPGIYSLGVLGFMSHHVLYRENVTDEAISFLLKSLCRIYRDRGFVIRTIVLFDDDPFEGTTVMKNIGMRADYRFVSLKTLKKKLRNRE